MLDNLAFEFLNNTNEENALNILRFARNNNLHYIGMVFGEFFSTLFPFSLSIKEEYAVNAYYGKEYEKAYDIFEEALQMKGLDQETSFRILFNQHFSIDHVANRYTYYDIKKVNSIVERKKSELPLVTLSITTCKRFDLFQQTMNSLINCLDVEMVDEWLCVYDNSSEEERTRMKHLYPFFTFIFKAVSNKGHPRSMNIIQYTVKTPYLLHLEDDWKFFVKKNYIKDALDVLNSNSNIGQCLFNKNYSEIESDIGVKGGIFQISKGGIRYYTHEYVYTDQQKLDWCEKYGNCSSSNYWPHFSLRPSVMKTEIFKKLGDFNESAGHFEMEYAHRYFNNNYISVFFEGICSIHIGRLTSEKHDDSKINAYKLNNEDQFVKKKPLTPIEECSEIDLKDIGLNIKTYVLNLDRRPDRWEKFKRNAKPIDFLNYERYSAVDGYILKTTPQLQRIFDGNDYNMKVGAVGCAMSHFKMYIELIHSDYDAFLILEDDIEFADNFDLKLLHLCNQLKNVDWDLVFLGHHPKNLNDTSYKQNKLPIIEKWDVYTSFQNSLGGTIGYIITKKGAERVLDFINENRLINCVDTALQKCANTNPHLVFSRCVRNGVQEELDTDIQHNFDSLTVTNDKKIEDEIEYFKANDSELKEYNNLEELNSDINNKINKYFKGPSEDISRIRKICIENNIKYYTYDDQVIFVIENNPENMNMYFHIFKVNDKYTIQDCL